MLFADAPNETSQREKAEPRHGAEPKQREALAALHRATVTLAVSAPTSWLQFGTGRGELGKETTREM